MADVHAELAQILGVLAQHQVAFILVGGGAADLDVVPERSAENVARLLAAGHARCFRHTCA